MKIVNRMIMTNLLPLMTVIICGVVSTYDTAAATAAEAAGTAQDATASSPIHHNNNHRHHGDDVVMLAMNRFLQEQQQNSTNTTATITTAVTKNETDTNSDAGGEGLGCLCLEGPNGPVSNCFDVEDLEHCTCSSGLVVCEEEEDQHHHEEGDHGEGDHGYHHDNDELVDSSCHCDGDFMHCSTSDQEMSASDVCHCHDGLLECQEGVTVGSASVTVDPSCHCDADYLHCSTSEQEMVAADVCHCHDGILECQGGTTVGNESTSSHNDDRPWAEVIVTGLLVNLGTIAGALIVAGQWLNKIFCKSKLSPSTVQQWRGNIMPMFACGAILAAVFFLILPESFLLIRGSFVVDGHEDHDHRLMQEEDDDTNPETQTTWRWGTSIIGGFILPVLAHSLFPHSHDHDHGHDSHDHDHGKESSHRHDDQVTNADATVQTSSALRGVDSSTATTSVEQARKGDEGDKKIRQDSEDGDKLSDPESADKTANATVSDTSDNSSTTTKAESKYNITLLASLTIGDFLHQFTDGIFMGTAWLLCSREVAIAIAVATFVHCFPHQLAEHVMMTSQGGLSNFQAIALNFITGLSMVLGGIVVLASEPSSLTIGVILSIGGGVLLHVANAECLATAERNCTRPIHKLWGFLGFSVGVIPIGLVLLNHEHCHAH